MLGESETNAFSMKISLRWLMRWLPDLTADVSAIESALPMLGFSLESTQSTGVPSQFLVVGEILCYEKHPHADRLRVCSVDVGETSPRQIVCGASNFVPKDRVPVALPGCTMLDGTVIQAANFRGINSFGMMCSGRELGIEIDHSGLFIMDKSVAIGTNVASIFPDVSDVIFDLEITANRGDCMSHLGIARELAAYFHLSMADGIEEYLIGKDLNKEEMLLQQLDISCDGCSQFFAWGIRGVRVGKSPPWLCGDLERIGIRSVNNAVDITNWILAHCGQPLHAFDANKLHGGVIRIRRAKEGESLVAINHHRYNLDPTMLVVSDEIAPLAIAGIMGSNDAEVDANSLDLIVEGATFSPESIQRTSRKLGLTSDASLRFARGIDPRNTYHAVKMAVKMIVENCGGVADEAPRVFSPWNGNVHKKTISICGDFVREKFGINVDDREISDVLRRIRFTTKKTNGQWQVSVPSFREKDINLPIDLVEEFIRFYGIHSLDSQSPQLNAINRTDDDSFRFQIEVEEVLTAIGFWQCYNYSMRSGEEVEKFSPQGQCAVNLLRIDNPLNEEQTHLRRSIIPGLLDSLDYNLRNGNPAVRLFEVGHIWLPIDGKIYEAIAVAWIQCGESPQKSWSEYDAPNFYTMKALGERVAAKAGIATKMSQFLPLDELPWQRGICAQFGALGQFPYQFQCGLLDLQLLAERDIRLPIFAGEWAILPVFFSKKKKKVSFRPFGAFPPISRDLAVIVDELMTAESARMAVEKCIIKALPSDVSLAEMWIFDIYEGNGIPSGKKSIALRFHLSSSKRTLSEMEAQAIFTKIVDNTAQLDGFELRKL
ncbi:MAG: phenylalanine--tRNA ligase subunit beta [Puniceicoccales bacterium]|jgi:phenylalanyl-tRNA synthetase beta chain|nr:phenylalanine--tRNA ligase subunit beta [Puniceicoccales bacterium]